MAYGKKMKKRETISIPGYEKMIRAKRMAEVQMSRDDLRQEELRRNYMLELGYIRSALYGNLAPGVQHPLQLGELRIRDWPLRGCRIEQRTL